MRIGDDRAFLLLERNDLSPKRLLGGGDVALNVEVQNTGFRGKASEVWFFRDEISKFLKDLRTLESKRDGSAVLTDMSFGSRYDGFRLEICSVDNSGHMAVK